MDYFINHFQIFMLIFARIMGMFYTVSFFDSDSIPEQVRLGLIFFITITIFPVVQSHFTSVSNDIIIYAMTAIGEAAIGACIGLSISIYFAVFQLAGQYFTVQMGFGASEVFDPLSQMSLPLMGQYLYMVFVLIFMALNGPALIIKELFDSYDLVNLKDFLNMGFITSKYGLIAQFGDLLVIGLRISMPILGALLLLSITMGLLAKAAPQMNLLMIGFPISITVGFIVLMLMIPLLTNYISTFIDYIFKNVWFMMRDIKYAT